jgi:predicted Zn-dependent peptidase
VSIAYPTPAIDADHGARLILAEMLGQRMAAVRQGLGASYGVDASLTIYRAAGAFVMEGRVDAGRAGEALRAMRGGVAALRAGEDFDLAFAMARRAVLKRLLVAPGTSDGLAGIFTFVATHGLGPNWYDDLLLDVAHARPEEVRRVLERELAPDRESVGLQGPRAAVEQAYRDAGLVMTAFVD